MLRKILDPLFPYCILFALCISSVTYGREPWSDSKLPDIDGLQAWFDAAKCRGPESAEPQSLLAEWRDGSGNGRHLQQPNEKHRPTIAKVKNAVVIRFDGQDDHLTRAGLAKDLGEATVFIVGNPFSNGGSFRGFLAWNREGVNDYVSGMNLDQGPFGTLSFQAINAEGAGFGGARNLFSGNVEFGAPHILSLVINVGEQGVKLFVDGKSTGDRERKASTMRMDHLTVGARFYNNGGKAGVRDFLEGDLAEVLIFDRALSDDERTKIERYLSEKHRELLQARIPRPGLRPGEHRLISVPSPPVQMFVPGFTTRQMPVSLSNINNVHYREDGKLIALGYNGNVYVLTDTDGDGLEDHSEVFWESNGRTQAPIGMALTPPNYPLGRGVFLPVVGKLSLVVDENGDDKADREIIVAQGWTPLKHQVDTFGVAVDPRDNSIYFGLGTQNFANAYLKDEAGKGHYDVSSERGTILRVSPDFKSREILCTGIRFSVGLAFNREGDLFCSEQEGATWLANGNPFDELLHIQRGRHYGFPPRHPRHLPDVIDEPSTFDYEPQHQSTCGLQFNEPVNGGPTFGPRQWASDAIVTGYSRGKLYRTKLVKTPEGYIAQNHLIGSLNSLTVDACVTPKGELVVSTHSGGPDWGTGPGGAGKLYKITYREPEAPQPVLVWPQGPYEVRIAFDKPLPQESLTQRLERTRIEFGSAVAAGDRFEAHRPGYEVVHQQLMAARHELPVHAAQVTPDRRTLVLTTSAQHERAGYAISVFGDAATAAAIKSGDEERIRSYMKASQDPQKVSANDLDVAYTMHGIRAEWVSADGRRRWTGWLPHLDTNVARELTKLSAQHDEFWNALKENGTLTLTTLLDLNSMLRPAVQPGATLDFEWPSETTSVVWKCSQPFTMATAQSSDTTRSSLKHETKFAPDLREPVEIQLTVKTGGNSELSLATYWTTNEDKRPRPFPLRRFFVPWSISATDKPAKKADRLELAGGSWARGRELFFDAQAGCAKCHTIGGRGAKIGPDLSNVVHRDYNSVLRDITEPSFAINPEYIAHSIVLTDGRTLSGVIRQENGQLIVGNERGEITTVPLTEVDELVPSTVSTMPKGLPQQFGPERLKDLLTFLLVPPPGMPDYGTGQAPLPRKREEIAAVLAGAPEETSSKKRLKIVLVAGPKDHGPGEHDYPAWQSSWRELLKCTDEVDVDVANRWPSDKQLATADVLVFYQQGEWNEQRAKDLDAFQARGGGAVYLHYAVDGGRDPNGFAERIGLAWKGGASKFRHGPLELHFERGSSHPIARNFDRVKFVDETYWQLLGDKKRIGLLATAVEDDMPQPIFWTFEKDAIVEKKKEVGTARVVVSILGHYSWTFDDPLFRVLVFRSIAWAAHEPVDRFNELVTLGARVE